MKIAALILFLLLGSCSLRSAPYVNVQWCQEKMPEADGRLYYVPCGLLTLTYDI